MITARPLLPDPWQGARPTACAAIRAPQADAPA